MKKVCCIVIICIMPMISIGQIDTLEVAKGFKTILTFPGNYDFSVNGKELNFIESFPVGTNSQTARSVVLLTYNELADDVSDLTNYTVYTKDGFAYDFLLKLVKVPKRKRWSLTRDKADNLEDIKMVSSGAKKMIFQEQGLKGPIEVEGPSHQFNGSMGGSTKELGSKKGNVKSIDKDLYRNDREEYIRARCYYNQFNKGIIFKQYVINGDVILWLRGIYYDKEELYFQFVLENKGSIDYDVNFLKTFIGTEYGKRADEQILAFSEDYRYKVPKRVKRKTENHFFLVFEKFSLDKHKNLIVEIDELKGSRYLTLEIPFYLITKAKGFKE